MKKRYKLALTVYGVSLPILWLLLFSDYWYYTFVGSIVPAFVAYLIGAVSDYHNSKNPDNSQISNPKKLSLKLVFSMTILVMAIFYLALGGLGYTYDQFFILGIILYVVLPTTFAFILGWVIDVLRR